MASKTIRGGAALAAMLALGGFVSQAHAQFMRGPVNPNFRLPFNAGVGNGIGSGFVASGFGIGGSGFMPPAYSPPSYSYLINPGSYQNPPLPSYLGGNGTASLTTTPGAGTGWGNVTPGYDPYYSDPYMPDYTPIGGYLRGTADLTASLGNFVVSMQRARLIQEEGTRSQIDTRRKIWEEAEWERMHTVFTEDYRESLIRTEQRRARLEPPLNEIWSGRSLNVLLRADAAQQSKGNRGPTVNIPQEVLDHINLTVGTGGTGNIGLLKKTDTLRWPLALTAIIAPEIADPIKNLNQRIPEAREQAKLNNSVDPGLLKDIKKNVERLQEALHDRVGEMPPSDYSESKRYLNQLAEAVKALQDPNVENYLNGKYAAKGKTVAELVDNLTRVQGLEFAPATPGDEAAYRALYQAMHAYDTGLTQNNTQVSTPPTPPGSGDK